MAFLNALFGDSNARVIRSYAKTVEQINAAEASISRMDDDAIHDRVAGLRSNINGKTEVLIEHLPESFALVREASKRSLRQRHFDVQIIGGIVLHEGKIAEMRTGEGKTLVATLPVALNALAGHGVHIVTVNDYLAKRDTGWMGVVYHRLGLSCAAIVHEAAFLHDPLYTNEATSDPLLRHLRPISRREAYLADITYGTNNEFGFDYLRDNMAPDSSSRVQRELSYAIVDEVDSILIDEARTPLIISAPVEQSPEEYRQVDAIVKQFVLERDYKVDEKMRSVYPTEEGIAKMEKVLGVANLYGSLSTGTINIINQALKANSPLFERDKQYVVRNGEIVIVDEFTGRLMFGRRYSEGLHQAIEAKEGVEVKQESQTLATITFQNLFRLYGKLAGMTGTAATEAEEFHKIYNLDVVLIPTNRPMIRRDLNDSVYKTEMGKFTAVVREIKERHDRGQPVLAGTISIAKNELLSSLLEREGIPHEALNAKNHEREAQIIAQAGRNGAVTIATNMAGRGVDIILGGNPADPEDHARVLELGGLHVIGTERHEARRIDFQLRGRAGRQGDPGSSQFFISMEDDLMRIFGSERMKRLMDRLGVPDDMPIENRLVSKSIESAQKKVEGHNFDIRKHLVEYDDVMNKHREVVYRKRDAVLFAPPEKLREIVLGILEQELETLVSLHTSGEVETSSVTMLETAKNIVPLHPSDEAELRATIERLGPHPDPAQRGAIIDRLVRCAEKQYDEIQQAIGDETMAVRIVRSVVLRTIDTTWIDHLDLMDHLREGIGLRGYGQRDPLVEYKREAYQLFTALMNSINEQIAATVLKVGDVRVPERSPMLGRPTIETAPAKTMTEQDQREGGRESAAPAPTSINEDRALQKVGRNDPCPCGSGKKFKKCYLAGDPGCKLLT